MTQPSKKTITFVFIGLTVGIGVILLFKYLKGQRRPSSNLDFVPDTPAAKPLQAISASIFPLKNGSKGDVVKQLQSFLGVTADGIFGPQTAAALLAQTGKTAIASQADYDAIIKTITAKLAASSSKQRADQLYATWLKGGQLMAISGVKAVQVVKDAFGALNPTGKVLQLVANQKLNRNDYVLKGSTTSGNVLFEVTKGDLKGLYKVEANKVTVS